MTGPDCLLEYVYRRGGKMSLKKDYRLLNRRYDIWDLDWERKKLRKILKRHIRRRNRLQLKERIKEICNDKDIEW